MNVAYKDLWIVNHYFHQIRVTIGDFIQKYITRNLVTIYCVKHMSKETAPEMKFAINPVKKKPTRKYRKGSKYDPIIEDFVKANIPLAEIEVEGKTASYLSTQLGKRLEDNKKLAHISVSTANGMCYLENSKASKE